MAADIRKNADAFVIVGVGGSNQAARAVIECLRDKDAPEIFYAGNTLAPYELNHLLEKLRDKSVYINVIAKNFSTLEPGVSFRILRQFLTDKYGVGACSRIIGTGTVGSRFEKLCRDKNYTFLPFPEDVGGRYSAFSDVGLLPVAVAGIDIGKLVEGASEMEMRLKNDGSLSNPSFTYAAVRNLLLERNMGIEMLSFFEPRLRYLAKWWVQLFAESEGKDGKGIYPTYCEMSEELHSVGQYLQEGTPIMFETFLHVTDSGSEYYLNNDGIDDGFGYLDGKGLNWVNDVAYQATLQAHGERLPCICLEVERLDAWHMGQLFYFFMFSCYLSSRFLEVNPFNQPGVENYKMYMFRELQQKKKGFTGRNTEAKEETEIPTIDYERRRRI